MDDLFNKDETITDEDRIAMAQVYRVYQLLTRDDKAKIPQEFVETLLEHGNFKEVKPFKDKSEINMTAFSQKAKYLLMYLCTFNS